MRLHDVEAAMKRTKDQGHKAAAILSNVEQAMHSGFTLVCMWHVSPEHCRHLVERRSRKRFPLGDCRHDEPGEPPQPVEPQPSERAPRRCTRSSTTLPPHTPLLEQAVRQIFCLSTLPLAKPFFPFHHPTRINLHFPMRFLSRRGRDRVVAVNRWIISPDIFRSVLTLSRFHHLQSQLLAQNLKLP